MTTLQEKMNLNIAEASCHLVFIIIVILLFYLYIDFIVSIFTIHEDLNTINRGKEQGDSMR
jgi:hypothetical protein